MSCRSLIFVFCLGCLGHDWQEIDLKDFKNVERWYDALMSRPALSKGMEIPT